MKMDKSENLRHLLAELIRTHDLEPKILEQKVFALWSKVLRDIFDALPAASLGTKTVPISLSSNGILKIYTEYPPYKTALLHHKPEILDALNTELGRPFVTELRIEINQVRKTSPPETEDRSSRSETSEENLTIGSGNTHQITPEQLAKIEQALSSISDPQLKESLWQLFTTQSNRAI